MAGLIACILLFICYKYSDYQQKQKVEHYDLSKVNTLKLTMDMDKPLHVREQNLIAGKYDFKEGEYDALGKRH